MKRLKQLAGYWVLGAIGALQPLHGLEDTELKPEQEPITLSRIQQKGTPSCSFQCCPPQNTSCDSLAVFGDALYWKWTGARLEYAFDQLVYVPPNVVFSQITHDYNPDYQWGFRVGVAYRPCVGCTYSLLSYLRFDGSRGLDTFGAAAGFDPQVAGFGDVHADIRNEYQNVDFTLGYYVLRRPCLALHLYGGGRWVYIKEGYVFTGPAQAGPGQLIGFSKYNAGAFKLGLGGETTFICLTPFGSFDFLAVIGEQNSNERFTEPDRIVIRPEVSSVRVSFGLGAKVGLKYEQICRLCIINAEVGLEIQTYYDVLRRTVRRTDLAIEVSDVDGGFGGPYASLRVGY